MEAFAVRPWTSTDRALFDSDGLLVGRARTPEDARRIVAAVNFVDGVPTEALEAWSVGSIQDPFNDLAAELESVLLAQPRAADRRHVERRKGDRRRASTEVRVDAG
jgi:hypothetical protein